MFVASYSYIYIYSSIILNELPRRFINYFKEKSFRDSCSYIQRRLCCERYGGIEMKIKEAVMFGMTMAYR